LDFKKSFSPDVKIVATVDTSGEIEVELVLLGTCAIGSWPKKN